MKNQRSTMKNYHKLNNEKQSFLHSNYKYGALFTSALMSVLLINACSTEMSSENNMIVTDKTDRHIQSSKEIEDSIKNSYARLASKRSDVCPKLIQEENKVDIKPSMIQPVEEIKSLGKFKVKVSLHSEVDAEITVNVTSADTIQ